MFAKRLDEFIIRSYKNYAEFAKAIGVDRSTIWHYINGLTKPPLSRMEDFYKAGVNINWLITGEGSMFSDCENGLRLHEAYVEKTLIKNQELQ
jgi:transcriptional regulator with XRE-family HTH domain